MIEFGKAKETTLDGKTRELIGVGAAIAGNCLPCLRYHFAEAIKQGCTLDEISEAVDLAKKVKERPITEIYKLSEELLRKEKEKGDKTDAGI